MRLMVDIDREDTYEYHDDNYEEGVEEEGEDKPRRRKRRRPRSHYESGGGKTYGDKYIKTIYGGQEDEEGKDYSVSATRFSGISSFSSWIFDGHRMNINRIWWFVGMRQPFSVTRI